MKTYDLRQKLISTLVYDCFYSFGNTETLIIPKKMPSFEINLYFIVTDVIRKDLRE